MPPVVEFALHGVRAEGRSKLLKSLLQMQEHPRISPRRAARRGMPWRLFMLLNLRIPQESIPQPAA